MTTRMSSDALSKVEREHRWSKCFDNSPWRTLRMTLREAVTLKKKLHLLYDISLYPTLWLHTLAIWIYWGSAAFEYLIVMNVWFIMTLFSSIYVSMYALHREAVDFIVFYKIRMWYILTHCMAISNTHPMISSSWNSGVPLKREDGGNRLSIESILPEPILGFFHPSSALWYQSVSHYCSYHIYLRRQIGTHTAFE